MHVVATAGHVDHGKSTLVRALTGMEPDRWAEERRRGMTLDLGFAWTTLPSGRGVAFVDVPGHERFVPTMLAGVGPVPAVLLVVAADGGWMPQSAEHLAAVDALGVRHGLVAVTRSDLADPGGAIERALAEVAATSLGAVAAVAVSGATGAGLDELRAALDRLLAAVPAPDGAAPVRLWLDRVFTVRGSGTVVTGTLGAGTLRVGDELELVPGGRRVGVRALQSQGSPVTVVAGTARVAVNLRGVSVDEVTRGAALVTPGEWTVASAVDGRLTGRPVPELPAELVLHAGSAAVPVRVRPLGTDTARVSLSRPLPLHVGDRVLLRDPGRRSIAGGLRVLDVDPPALRRRGAGAARAVQLSTVDGSPDGVGELARRGAVRAAALRAMGLPEPAAALRAGGWLVDPGQAARWRAALARAVAEHAAAHPLEHGLPVEAARQQVGLPDVRLVPALLADPAADQVHQPGDDRSGHFAGQSGRSAGERDRQRAEELQEEAGDQVHQPAVPALLADPAGDQVHQPGDDRSGHFAGQGGRSAGERDRRRAEQLHEEAGDGGGAAGARDEGGAAAGARDEGGAAAGARDEGAATAGDLGGPVLVVRDGRVAAAAAAVPAGLRPAVDAVRADLTAAPYAAPEAHRLAGLGLGRRELAAAVRAGALLRVADGVYLLPGADDRAAELLAELPQPFTLSEARRGLRTTRRVAVPLLELLDARGLTERLPDDRRRVRSRHG
ncbi:MAG: selenocysteine-specific translation elongation factor [Mycobacteriales bacterium]